jgi:hypothetical protein
MGDEMTRINPSQEAASPGIQITPQAIGGKTNEGSFRHLPRPLDLPITHPRLRLHAAALPFDAVLRAAMVEECGQAAPQRRPVGVGLPDSDSGIPPDLRRR